MKQIKIYKDERLDIFISKSLNISRNQALRLIQSGCISKNNEILDKPSIKIDGEISINFLEPTKQENKFEVDFDIPIIYEDDDILIINKPSGIASHGASSLKEASLVEWLNEKNFMLSNLNGEFRPGIVHRLDKGTSGAMIVAKTNKAHEALSLQLRDKSMGRIYLLMCDNPLKQNCIIQRNIARNPSNRLKNIAKSCCDSGKFALSAFSNLLVSDNISLICAKLFTGRTHQIRAHLASINRYILGDTLYGFKSEKDNIKRVMLHAYYIYFIHPISGKNMKFKANIYDDFNEILFKHFEKKDIYENTKTDYIDNIFSDTNGWLLYN